MRTGCKYNVNIYKLDFQFINESNQLTFSRFLQIVETFNPIYLIAKSFYISSEKNNFNGQREPPY